MELKDKRLIRFFGKKIINQEDVSSHFGTTISLDYTKKLSVDLNELSDIIKNFPSIEKVQVVAESIETIENAYNTISSNVGVPIEAILIIKSKEEFDKIPEETSKNININRIIFRDYIRKVENINVSEISNKFPFVEHIQYPYILDKNNITHLDQISYMIEKCYQIDLNPEIL